MAIRTPKTIASLMAHKTSCRVGLQSGTNRLMRSSVRSRGIFSGSTCLPPFYEKKYGASHRLERVRAAVFLLYARGIIEGEIVHKSETGELAAAGAIEGTMCAKTATYGKERHGCVQEAPRRGAGGG